MKRRDFLRNLSAGAAGLTLGGPHLFNAHAQPNPDQPNVLFIILEDMANWAGCLGGHPDAMTPNIDALAGRGALFTDAHCTAPVCNPSRTSMLLSMLPSSTGVYLNHDDWRENIPADTITMGRHFHNHDYFTLRSGKIWHGTFYDNDAWDRAYLPITSHNLPGHDPYLPNHPNAGLPYALEGVNFMNWGATDIPNDSMSDQRRLDFIRLHMQAGIRQPFFMAFGATQNHYPAVVPRRILERYNPADVHLPEVHPDDLTDLPPYAYTFLRTDRHDNVVNHKQYRKAVAAYLATLEHIDEIVGRLIYQIDNSPYADNTIIILAVDHGYHLGEKHHWEKGTLWNESTNSLLTIYAPGVTQPGTVINETVSLLDIWPTMNDLCNLPPVDHIEGESLVPLMLNPGTERDTPAIVTLTAGNHAIITEQWRYIHYVNGDEELYNRIDDPNEWTNLAMLPEFRPIMDNLALWLPDDG